MDRHKLSFFTQEQGQIQDFEMGGENIKKKIKKSYIISIFEGYEKKKRKKGGSEKAGMKIRPFYRPWISA